MGIDKLNVSVLMSVYNEDTLFLKESIESVLRQTYKDIEFVIIGDSPNNDRVNNIVRDYQSEDNRILFHINEKNIGLTRSLNVGLRLCKGKYIVRMDADDISMPTRIEKQVDYMERHPQINACGSYVRFIDENGHIFGKRKYSTNRKKLAVQSIFIPPICHPSAIIRKKIEDIAVSYDESLRFAQDFGLWSSMPLGTLANIPEYLLLYRKSSKQISTAHRPEQFLCGRAVQIKNMECAGLSIKNDKEKVFDFLINSKKEETVAISDIEGLLLEIMKGYEYLVDKKQLWDYLSCRYMWCLDSLGYSKKDQLRILCNLSVKIGHYSFAPLKYATYMWLAK